MEMQRPVSRFVTASGALGLSLAVAAALAAPAPAQGAVVWNDTFTNSSLDANGDVTSTDAKAGAWYRFYNASLGPTFSVGNDATINDGNALTAAVPTDGRPSVGTFPSVSLGTQIGDSVKYSLDFHFASTPADYGSGLRFGLFQSVGTQGSADGGGTSGVYYNDRGYRVFIPTGSVSPRTRVYHDGGSNAQILRGGGPTTGVTTVADSDDNAGVGGVVVNDADAHSAGLIVTRTASGVQVSVTYDGVVRVTGDDNASPFTHFDLAPFGNFSDDTSLTVDNVRLQTLPIPEPASLALLGLGGLALCGRRRRRG